MKIHEETIVEISSGKTIIIKLLSIGNPDENGIRVIFFKVNGQNRFVEIEDRSLNITKVENIKSDPDNINEIGAPLQGMLYKILVKKGQEIKKNDPLFVIEAMKMETTVTAIEDGKIKLVSLKDGVMVGQDDLIISME